MRHSKRDASEDIRREGDGDNYLGEEVSNGLVIEDQELEIPFAVANGRGFVTRALVGSHLEIIMSHKP